MTIDAPVSAGQRATFVFRIRHDGPDAALIRLSARGRDLRADVVWRLGGQEVTDALDRGDLRLRVGAGDHRDLTLGVTLRRSVPEGFTLTRTLTAEALAGGARDRVRVVVTRGPSPVRFHDVGLALGLPRHTHSFDLDAGPVDGDGIDDLVMSTHGRVEVFLNRQPGLESAFVEDTGDLHACALGRADADDRTDIYCTRGASNGNEWGNNALWVQQPDGSFVNQAGAYGVTDPLGRGRHPTFVDLDHRRGIDLFVGNENPRSDDNQSLNRTFLHAQTAAYVDAQIGMRADIGSLCAQAVDQDANGWDDLLVCGGAGLATVGWHPSQNRLHLFRNVRRPDGGRWLVDVASRLQIALDGVKGARLAHLDGDGLIDLVVVKRTSVSVWPGTAGGGFGLPVFREDLQAGHSVAIADLDGRLGLDMFVVQACGGPRHVNLEDRLYLDVGPGWTWERARLPTGIAGCGDIAEALDVDGDGIDDIVVGNGLWSAEGPVQVLTSGRYWG